MPARSLLIRLLLSFAMILNGSVAVAGVMPGMVGAGEASMVDAAMAVAGDCHGMEMQQPVADGNAASMQHATASQTTGDSSDHITQDHATPHHTTPDCCEGGACQCACTHATAGVDFSPLVFAVIAISEATALVDRSVAATRPSRLDRPPIG